MTLLPLGGVTYLGVLVLTVSTLERIDNMIYTYPVHGFGFMPDPDNVQDHDTAEDAYAALIDDIRVTCEHLDSNTPNNLPTLSEVQHAIQSGAGLVYAHAGWLHVVGVD